MHSYEYSGVAATYRSDHSQKDFDDLINKATAFIQENISWIGVDFKNMPSTLESGSRDADSSERKIRVLDYACGPGTVTNALMGYADEFVGIDLSPNMVKEYNTRFSQQQSEDSANAEASAGNLFAKDASSTGLSDPKFFNFDLVVVGLGFHHFEDLPLVTERLTERIKPGGVLLILDFLTHDKEDLKEHPAHITVSHHGFSEEQVCKLFSDAGLGDCKTVLMGEKVLLKGTAERRPFMARGRKPAS